MQASLTTNMYSASMQRISQWLAIALAFAIPISTSLMQILFIAVAFFALCSGNWYQQYQTIVKNRMALLFLSFFGLFLLGLIYTTVPLATAFEMVVRYHRYLLGLFLFYVLRDERIRYYAIYAFLLAVAIAVVLSYIKYFTHTTWFNSSISPDDPAPLKNHIDTSFVLAIGAYFSALLWIKNQRGRWWLVLLFAVIVFNLFYINIGRAGYIIFIALALLFSWQFARWKGILIAVCVCAVLVGSAVLLSTNFQRSAEAVKSDAQKFQQGDVNTSQGLRVEFYKTSLQMIKAHPLLGTGTGSLTAEYAKACNYCLYATTNPHNEYLNMMIQFGIVGLAILLLMFGFQWYDSFRLPQDMAYIAQAVLVAIAVGCLVNSWLMDAMEGYFYVYFTALAFAALSNSRKVNNKILGRKRPSILSLY